MCEFMKNNINKLSNKYNNLTIEFLENYLKLEGMKMTSEEKFICTSILSGKIDLEAYKKAVLSR